MLAQVLNRDFVLYHLEHVQGELEKLQTEPATTESEDIKDTAKQIADALSREEVESSGQVGYEDPEARRGDEPAKLDDFVFISHDRIISLAQSALEQYFQTDAQALIKKSPPPDDQRRGEDDALPVVTD